MGRRNMDDLAKKAGYQHLENSTHSDQMRLTIVCNADQIQPLFTNSTSEWTTYYMIRYYENNV